MTRPGDATVTGASPGETACEALICRHHGLVHAACRRQVPASEVDDCVQAVFLVLLRRSDQATRSSSLEAWLLTVARHVCATARRTVRNRRHAERGAALQSPRNDPPSIASVSDLLDECLADLPKRQRDAITLHYLTGKSREEVATELGIGVEAVHKQCQRGLERLRERLRRRGAAVPLTVLLAVFAGEAQAASVVPPASAIAMSASQATGTPASLYASGALTAMAIATLTPLSLMAAAALLIVSGTSFIVSAVDAPSTTPSSPAGSPSGTTAVIEGSATEDGLPVGWWTDAGPDVGARTGSDVSVDMNPWQRAAQGSLMGTWEIRDVSDQAPAMAKVRSTGDPIPLNIPSEPRDVPNTTVVITEDAILVQEAGKQRVLFDRWRPGIRSANMLVVVYLASMKPISVDQSQAMDGGAVTGKQTIGIPQLGSTRLFRLGRGFVLADGARYLWAWRRK
jgi:RNA polymerase sigma factor (sigma-70 family)